MSTQHMTILNERIAKELSQQQVVCGWHMKNFGTTLILSDGDSTNQTHGICTQCKAIYEGEVLALSHTKVVAEIAAKKEPVERLAKPQEFASSHSTKTVERGRKIVVSAKETPWSYEGIDIV